MKLPFSTLVHDKSIDVYFLKGHEFNYCDGQKIEKYILKVLRESKDTSIFSEELRDKIKDWPSYYHFSSLRQNICRPIHIDKRHDILEIGSGCGAITRYLAETALSVTCIEGGYMRALSTRARCKDLDNVTVINANFNDLDFEQKFDIITLIGVFEYTAKYSNKDNPFEEALLKYKSLLKPGGRIIIAIENKLGIKYFMGQVEDHYGKPYYGIEDRYKEKGIRTFGKSEIEEMTRKLDFKSYFYFPFPDYKLPIVLLSSEALQIPNLNIFDLVALCEPDDYTGNLRGTFDYFLSLKSIIDNKVLDYLSNSFLVELSIEEPSTQKVLAFHYSTERKNGYNTKTEIFLEDDKIKVSKTLISGQILKSDTVLIKHNIIKKTSYINGHSLFVQMVESIKKQDFRQFENLLKLWYGFLIKNITDKPNILQAHCADCLPQNLIIDNKGTLHYFDSEWEYKDSLSLEFMLIRFSNFIRNHLRKEKIFFKEYGISLNDTLKSFCSILNIIEIKNNNKHIIQGNILFNTVLMKYINPKKSEKGIRFLFKKTLFRTHIWLLRLINILKY